MNRLASIRLASAQVRRRIWASLPSSVRFAELMIHLASHGSDAFGKVVMGEFIKAGVTDLPPVNGKPALEFTGGTNRLPSGYGREIGNYCYRTLKAKYHRDDFVEDIMSRWLTKRLEKGFGVAQGTPFKRAQQFVMQGLINEAIDQLRKKREVSDSYGGGDDDDEERRHEVVVHQDESTSDQLKQLLADPMVKHRLDAIHPDAAQYLTLFMEGYKDREIFNDKMLAHPLNKNGVPLTVYAWAPYKTKIFQVLKNSVHGDINALV